MYLFLNVHAKKWFQSALDFKLITINRLTGI